MESKQVQQIDLRAIFETKVPKLMKRMPNWLFRRIQRLLHEDDINAVLSRCGHLEGVEFVQAVVRDFNLNVEVVGAENLAATDRFVVASNHPLGGLDGIALIGTVGEYRDDVLTPVNDFLMFIESLRPIFIPVNKVGNGVANRQENLKLFNETFASDKPICYFPFGLCSRMTQAGKIMDLDWKKTFVTKAKEFQRDIIPVHIDGRNSSFFYKLARLRRFLGIKVNIEMAFLVDEMFKQRNKSLTITIGQPISHEVFDKRFTDARWAEKLRAFSYQLSDDPNQVFDPNKDYPL